jgi:hypothetical protein
MAGGVGSATHASAIWSLNGLLDAAWRVSRYSNCSYGATPILNRTNNRLHLDPPGKFFFFLSSDSPVCEHYRSDRRLSRQLGRGM